MTFISPLLLAAALTAADPATAPPPAIPAPPPAPFANISYGPNPHELIDVYLPPAETAPTPVVICFGGLFKASMSRLGPAKFLAGHCAVVLVESRSLADASAAKISPPIQWPMEDAVRVVQFVRLHAKDWNIDPARIATTGSSQGTLPALYVACSPDHADPSSPDPVARESTRITCVGAMISQPSIDPKQMQAWVPGVEWGSQAFGLTFAQALAQRDQLLPVIDKYSPDHLLSKSAPPIYFENVWGLTKPADAPAMGYLVHSPRWGLGFQKLAQAQGVECDVKYPGHDTPGYANAFDFIMKKLGAL
jgi:acetyl esterase/lipase